MRGGGGWGDSGVHVTYRGVEAVDSAGAESGADGVAEKKIQGSALLLVQARIADTEHPLEATKARNAR